MPKGKLQEVFFTCVMAGLMVYGMIVYNVSLSRGGVSAESFTLALHELPLMFAVAFVLEFFLVGKLAARLAFSFVRPTDRPQLITYAISFCIVCIMCPTMSLVATLLFQGATLQTWFPVWVQTMALNLPAAMLLQFCYVGPFSRLVLRTLFQRGEAKAPAPVRHDAPEAC